MFFYQVVLKIYHSLYNNSFGPNPEKMEQLLNLKLLPYITLIALAVFEKFQKDLKYKMHVIHVTQPYVYPFQLEVL